MTELRRDETAHVQPSASDFVARFADAWAQPDLVKHRALWHDDIRLVQPMAPTSEGADACLEQMAAVCRLIPDLRADVHAAEVSETSAFIEFTWLFPDEGVGRPGASVRR